MLGSERSSVYDVRGMPPTTPYSTDLGNREPIATMRDSMARLRALAGGWSAQDFERSYAPGKWPARTILTHLAHSELAFGNRARMALAAPQHDYIAQPFNQDAWMARASALGGREAPDAPAPLCATETALYASLAPAQP